MPDPMNNNNVNSSTTMLSDLINPQVMADMISAGTEKRICVAPFAAIDTTLRGRAGDTVTVPSYNYIGDAEDIAEGVAAQAAVLETSSRTFTVKKAMKAVELTDEAVLCGYGNPVGETNSQLARAIASKVDADAMDALYTAPVTFTDCASEAISYPGIVRAIDLFAEEIQSPKVIFIHPAQLTQLRLDADFISADRYDNNVVMYGEIGMIAGCRVVVSRRVESENGTFKCPIIKLNGASGADDDAPALTVFLKRGTNVETERDTLSRKTAISADRIYGVALTNEEKVVVASFAAN